MTDTVQKLTKQQAVIISAYTGYLCCEFADMHEEIERRLGHPVWTHQLGNMEFCNLAIRPLFKDDFVAMAANGEVCDD